MLLNIDELQVAFKYIDFKFQLLRFRWKEYDFIVW